MLLDTGQKKKYNRIMKWNDRKITAFGNYGIFSVNKVLKEDSRGKQAEFVMLDAPDWVNVIATVKDDQGKDAFLMVRQFRHGSSEITREFPAGAIDNGETALEAAARELREETGYEAEKLTVIGSVCPNPAFMNNTVYTVLAVNAVHRHDQEFDEHEYIEIEITGQDAVQNNMGSGEYNNGVMLMALFFYNRYLELNKE